MSTIGRKNGYTCLGCGKITVTVERAEGVTPHGIQCPHCGSLQCYSWFYRGAAAFTPSHEFYRPTEEELVEHTKAEFAQAQKFGIKGQTLELFLGHNRKYAADGGLFLRRIPDVGAAGTTRSPQGGGARARPEEGASP